MKLMKRLSGGLVALVIAAAFSAQAAEQGLAKVVNIKGAARYTTADNSTWRPLKSGTVLRQGAVIQTASDSHVDLILNNQKASAATTAALGAMDSSASASTVAYVQPKTDQDAVRIYENTVLGLDKLIANQTGIDKVTETQLDLKAGRILGTVKKLSAGSSYEVKIPNGVAGVRGTIYTLSADGILSVLTGSVVMAYVGADGTPTTQEVRAGQQYDAKTGQITNIPESELRQRIKEARDIGMGPETPGTTFAIDRTIYVVSPTRGQGDDGFEFPDFPDDF
ncbi:MAG TPA: FecR domain-containing protein [Verrucomicrobiae bacterium]|nr:FecR domain-containing protein [Verrucomicrobiae bacterium]